MNNYKKPVVLLNEELAEGVYAASGADEGGTRIDQVVNGSGDDCWKITGWIHQTPETGREDYRIQLTGNHIGNTDKHKSWVSVTIHFNQAITSAYCTSGQTCTVNGSSVTYGRDIGTFNPGNGVDSGEGLGLGDLVVTSGDNLNIVSIEIKCDGIGVFQ